MYRIICGFVYETVTAGMIWLWCGLALAAYVIKIVCFAGSTGLAHQAAYYILENLRLRVADRFLHAPLGEVQGHTIGEIKGIIVDKIENIGGLRSCGASDRELYCSGGD